MPSDDIAISVRNLSKTYRIFCHPGDRLKQAITFGIKRYHREFSALTDVSFDIRKGESVGIIGRNGSGKSTLLQLICGTLKPTTGTVNINGRISALLELGAGFNPEFTGRENVFFQGMLSGLARTQIEFHFEEIAAFADIGDFIDQPVRTYSSGMFVRLAFATAIHVEPDILVIDEALAVGDLAFQRKSFSRIEKLLAQGERAVLLVSHDLRQIERFCTRAIYLRNGKLADIGKPYDICKSYYQRLNEEAPSDALTSMSATGSISSSGEIALLSLEVLDSDGQVIDRVGPGQPLNVRLRLSSLVELNNVELIIGTQTEGMMNLSSSSTVESRKPVRLQHGVNIVEFCMPCFPVSPGCYLLRVVVRDANFRILFLGEGLSPFVILPGPDEFNRPPRLLDLEGEWTVNDLSL